MAKVKDQPLIELIEAEEAHKRAREIILDVELGPAISIKIIERYGGGRWAKGTPGSEAFFLFTIPAGDNGA